MEKDEAQPIIIKKKKGHGHGHHGGGWKVAFADFMTAMMAFFLLMWLLESASPEELKAIAGYFNDPGGSILGPGGASPGVIPLEDPNGEAKVIPNFDVDKKGDSLKEEPDKDSHKSAGEKPNIGEILEKLEKKQLAELKEQLEDELSKMDSVFQLLKDQILIDFTDLGLRVQIIDKDKRLMFDAGSSTLKPYSQEVLEKIAELLNKVPNKISITGHTDATQYGDGAEYTNWELSSDRANSARRALLSGKYPERKIGTVQGMASSAPLYPDNPDDPKNRRIAIIVLKKAVSDAMVYTSGVSSGDLLDTTEGSPELSDVIESATDNAEPISPAENNSSQTLP
ncbi:MAG: flagellar motor protein MotB [Pseudomonadota bacterium]